MSLDRRAMCFDIPSSHDPVMLGVVTGGVL